MSLSPDIQPSHQPNSEQQPTYGLGQTPEGKPYVGPEWTPEERQVVVLAITRQMREYPRPLASQSEVATWGQKIYFVLTHSAEFLENNREQILEELSISSSK